MEHIQADISKLGTCCFRRRLHFLAVMTSWSLLVRPSTALAASPGMHSRNALGLTRHCFTLRKGFQAWLGLMSLGRCGSALISDQALQHCSCALHDRQSNCCSCWCTGSDDGKVYIWDTKTGGVICALQADEDIVNSVAAHPTLPYLATSGIEDRIRIWGPNSSPVHQDLSEQIRQNQVSVLNLLRGPHAICLAVLASKVRISFHCCVSSQHHKKACFAVQENIQKGPRMLLSQEFLQAISGTHQGVLHSLLSDEQGVRLRIPDSPGGCTIS